MDGHQNVIAGNSDRMGLPSRTFTLSRTDQNSKIEPRKSKTARLPDVASRRQLGNCVDCKATKAARQMRFHRARSICRPDSRPPWRPTLNSIGEQSLPHGFPPFPKTRRSFGKIQGQIPRHHRIPGLTSVVHIIVFSHETGFRDSARQGASLSPSGRPIAIWPTREPGSTEL